MSAPAYGEGPAGPVLGVIAAGAAARTRLPPLIDRPRKNLIAFSGLEPLLRQLTIPTLTSLVLLGAASGPALAYCPHLPDGPASGNVANGTAHSVCLQSELAQETEILRQRSEVRSLTQDVQLQQLRQPVVVMPLPQATF